MRPLILTLFLCGLYIHTRAQAPAEIRQHTAPALGSAVQEVQQAPGTGPELRQKTAPALGMPASTAPQPSTSGPETRSQTAPVLPGNTRQSDPRN